jgi:tetratricopeptide (TPR) repeat protein
MRILMVHFATLALCGTMAAQNTALQDVSVSPATATAQSSAAPSLKAERAFLQQGKMQDAFAMLQQLSAADPSLKGLHHDFGVLYYRTNKLLEAQREFEAAIGEDSADKESVQMEGLTLYRMGQPGRAIPFLQQVHDWMPNADADSNNVLGLCYLNAKLYDEARGAFALEYGVDPASASAYLLMSTMLMHADLPELAAGEVQKALARDATIPLAHYRLGEVYLFKSDIPKATEEFEQERRMNPGYAPTYDRLGDVYTRAGKFEDAQQALTRAIALDVSSTGPFIQMGKVLLRRDDEATAALYLRHAEKMDPSNYITHTLLAQAYRRAGQEDEAKRELDLAAKIHEDERPKLESLK